MKATGASRTVPFNQLFHATRRREHEAKRTSDANDFGRLRGPGTCFYVEKLGFSHMMGMLGKDGQLDFCTVILGGAKVMLMRPQERTEGTSATSSKRPVEIYLEVSDVDEYHARLVKLGVKITSPLTDQWWGDRTLTVMDPFGYQIWFYQTVGKPKPPKGAKIV